MHTGSLHVSRFNENKWCEDSLCLWKDEYQHHILRIYFFKYLLHRMLKAKQSIHMCPPFLYRCTFTKGHLFAFGNEPHPLKGWIQHHIRVTNPRAKKKLASCEYLLELRHLHRFVTLWYHGALWLATNKLKLTRGTTLAATTPFVSLSQGKVSLHLSGWVVSANSAESDVLLFVTLPLLDNVIDLLIVCFAILQDQIRFVFWPSLENIAYLLRMPCRICLVQCIGILHH